MNRVKAGDVAFYLLALVVATWFAAAAYEFYKSQIIVETNRGAITASGPCPGTWVMEDRNGDVWRVTCKAEPNFKAARER